MRRTKGFAVLFALCSLVAPAAAITGDTHTSNFKNVDEGVQFAPNWVLTASHIGLIAGSTYSNGFGTSLVDTVYTPPGAGFPNHDLKLVRLTNAISTAPVLALSSTLFAPTPFNPSSPALNIDVTLTSNSNTGGGLPRAFAFGQLREFVNTFSDDHDNNVNTPPLLRTVNWFITHQNGFGAPFVQSGDSGGGLFLGHVTDQTSPLMGIGSALLGGVNGVAPAASAYVSVASYRSWIDQTMTSNLADNQMPNWVSSPVPEPAGWALWLAGGAAGLFWRRRARSAALGR